MIPGHSRCRSVNNLQPLFPKEPWFPVELSLSACVDTGQLASFFMGIRVSANKKVRALLKALYRRYLRATASGEAVLLDNVAEHFVRLACPTGSDKDLVFNLNVAALNIDKDSYLENLLALLDSLEQRLSIFEDPAFDKERFEGWCSILNFAAGITQFANQHFLDRLGEIIDDEEIFVRMCRLCQRGLIENERRFDISVLDVDDWMQVTGRPGVLSRNKLANAANYLGRTAYHFRFQKQFYEEIGCDLDRRFDVAIKILTFGQIPIRSKEDVLYKDSLSRIETFKQFVLGEKALSLESYKIQYGFKDGDFDRIFSYFVRLCDQFEDTDVIFEAASRFAIDNPRVAGSPSFNLMIPFFMRRLKTLGLVTDYLTSRNRRSVADKFRAINIAKARGELDLPLSDLLKPGRIAEMSLGDIYQLVPIVRALRDTQQQYSIIAHIQKRLIIMANSSVGNQLTNTNFVARCVAVDTLLGDVRVMEQFHAAMKKVQQASPTNDEIAGIEPEPGSTVAVLCLDQDRVTPNLLPPLLAHLPDIRFYSLTRDSSVNAVVKDWDFTPQLSPSLDVVEGMACASEERLCDWVIEPESRTLTCNGLDVYHPLYERISRVQKAYTIDWDMPVTRRFMNIWIRQIDRLVYALEAMRAYCEDRDVRVRFVSLQSQFVPWAVLKLFAARHPERFNHITFGSSYENWKSNMSGEALSSLIALNNTLHPSPGLPAFGRSDDFEKWYQEVYLPRKSELWSQWSYLVTVNRSGELTEETATILNDIKMRAKRSARVFCALGKIPYDLCVGYKGGPAHSDMQDWINHVVDSVRNTESLLILKPHPHEMNYAISAKPNQGFLDLIDVDIPSNVIVLPHRGISLGHLTSLVDHFLCWNGSSIAELGAADFSIIAADDWAAKNYPVNVFLPENREHMEKILSAKVKAEMHPEFHERSRAYVVYLTTAPFAVPYPFTRRSSSNADFNRSWVNWDAYEDSNAIRRLSESADKIRAAFNV